MRRATIVAALLVVLAGCGQRAPSPPAAKAPVAQALREWARSARAEDVRALCARTFMAYDAPRRLWPRIGLNAPETPGYPPRTAPPGRIRRDCLDEYGHGGRSMGGSPRIVKIREIHVEGPVHDAAGIARTAWARVTVGNSDQTVDWHARLVLYRGGWRVLQGYD